MFLNQFNQFNWAKIQQNINSKTDSDVLRTLQTEKPNLEDFCSLISPSAKNHLEAMAQKSQKLTQKRFGKTIQMFIPLYLSNECQNICTYCGFSYNNKIPRKTLSDKEILQEVKIIKNMGYEHALLVTGEANKTVGVEYLKNAIQLIKPFFSQISLEVQPLEQQEYQELIELGLYSVLVYQETYSRTNYSLYHTKGKKSLFDYRLDTPDRLGKAGIHKIGLGCLLGLSNWMVDSFFVAAHLEYLEKHYWKTRFSISFPRLRPHEGEFVPNHNITNKDFVQLLLAYRIWNENLDLSISTRESQTFRDQLIPLGVSSMSAGSKTNPGGYQKTDGSLKQFEIDDNRSPQEMSAVISKQNYEPVWKDWDLVLN